jgi:hypothetical protein
MPQLDLSIKRATEDAKQKIEAGTLYKVSEFSHEESEDLHTLATLHAKDDKGEVNMEDKQKIFTSLRKTFPEYGNEFSLF